jgi:DMSO/TMAO reductase YedYZ molybdopterin-dependent catalytic subunit
LTTKFPVLTYGPTPEVKLETWKFKVFGLVEQPLELNWEGFNQLPWTTITADFHCVTQWSALDNTWEGVRLDHLMSLAKPLAQANFVMAHCEGGYTTNLPLDLSLEEGFLAHKQDGKPLEEGHGWPLRLIIPSRYGWKSAKWLSALELMAEDRPGFWEERGYHNDGDPWKQERFWPELTG